MTRIDGRTMSLPLSRQRALEVAIRRWMRLMAPVWETPTMGLSVCHAYGNVPYSYVQSIRAHYRAVCRQYGVKEYTAADAYRDWLADV